ncbi:sensor histidine kinase [Methanovulcanius yangii]|uniref:sensor histidine kinase n=1 Tax=Methanovulcanius yangii TaxID=1789227 RepID=UPI0029CA2B46|nr:histidine kinase dimerization/phosphoacceptor domain -containing protein [Methanovulcanius yangii]
MIPVLFVVRDMKMCERAHHFLSKSGEFRVDFAFSAPDALGMLEETVYGVVIADYLVPGLNGESFLETFRGRGYATPIIVVGQDAEGIVVDAINKGADYFLHSPVDSFQFYAEMNHLLKKALSQQSTEESLRKTREQMRTIEQQAEGLESSLQEKDILIKEVHHRVKNNLQLISSILKMHYYRTDDAETKEILENCRNRIFSMATIHEHLYRSDNLAAVRMADYIPRLAANLSSQRPDDLHGVEILTRCDPDITLDIDTCIPCGIIINELITNALKYGYGPGRRGEIVVSLHHAPHRPGFLRLEVTNDGAVPEEALDLESATTLGMQLVSSLTAQIDGEAEVRQNGSLTIAILFPDPSARKNPAEF